jgi:predicted Zn-dependent protease with MMP-like domain
MRPRKDQRRWERLRQAAQAEVEGLLEGLPAPIAEPARALPVTFEAVPNAALVKEGLPPDTLGLFVGLAFNETESGIQDLPPQILLFLENIWSYARGDTRDYREEVRRTYLHELGHYLGLDEDGLLERDLD